MKLDAPWLSSAETQRVFAIFSDTGAEAFAVGGCVRNTLMGKEVADIDMASALLPQRVSELAVNAGLKVIPTGIEHGTVTVLSGGIPYEITTFRADVETDGRHATVRFATDLAEDAKRRDFTINAVYCDAKGQVIDPENGLPDIEARRVRFIGNPAARIREDYLRILRFFRFFAWYGGPGIDADGLASCAELADGLEDLSRERVGAEMIKLLSAHDPAPSIAAMAQSGVLFRVMPGAEASSLPLLVHFEDGLAPDWLARTAALTAGDDLAERWRLSKKDKNLLAKIISARGADLSLAAIGFCDGPRVAQAAALLRAADTQTGLPADWGKQIARGVKAKFPVDAADLMPALEGPALGEKLDALKARWLASDLTLDRDALLADGN